MSVNQIRPVLEEVAQERLRQIDRFGIQNHPDGTGGTPARSAADWARTKCDENAAAGSVTWRDILREETYEALAETDPVALRTELIQVAAVASAWVEALDRRLGGGSA
jgi:hypothetical protein